MEHKNQNINEPLFSPTPPKKSSTGKEIMSLIGVLLAAVAVPILIFCFVFRSYVVDGPSMGKYSAKWLQSNHLESTCHLVTHN